MSLAILLPALSAALVALVPRTERLVMKVVALFGTLAVAAIALYLWHQHDPALASFQFEERASWVPELGVSYWLGIDGISLVLVALTAFLFPLVLMSVWPWSAENTKEFIIALLCLETGILGAFFALDLFLFYVFWEAMLIPMYFVIGIWGGQRRVYAATKFFLFTLAGSLLLLLAILWVARQPDGTWNFALDAALRRSYAPSVELTLFAAFALAFGIKVPLVPVHTWLPDAHVEAPTAGSVVLAAVLLKLGVYGFLRFAFPMFPQAALTTLPLLGGLAAISIVYGALAAWVQPDMKKLVAYSSVSHLGFCMLGLAAFSVETLSGAVFIAVAHGVSTGALFLLVGALYERRHTRMMADYGGIAKQVPILAGLMVFMVMASAGLPALSGFPGEFLVVIGAFTRGGWATVSAVVAAFGVILASIYLLWMLERVFFGRLGPDNTTLADLNLREIAMMVPFVVFAVWLGLEPGLILRKVEPSLQRVVTQVSARNHVASVSAESSASIRRAEAGSAEQR